MNNDKITKRQSYLRNRLVYLERAKNRYINNYKGYIKGNVIIVSWKANRLKWDASKDELLKLANFYKRFA